MHVRLFRVSFTVVFLTFLGSFQKIYYVLTSCSYYTYTGTGIYSNLVSAVLLYVVLFYYRRQVNGCVSIDVTACSGPVKQTNGPLLKMSSAIRTPNLASMFSGTVINHMDRLYCTCWRGGFISYRIVSYRRPETTESPQRWNRQANAKSQETVSIR